MYFAYLLVALFRIQDDLEFGLGRTKGTTLEAKVEVLEWKSMLQEISRDWLKEAVMLLRGTFWDWAIFWPSLLWKYLFSRRCRFRFARGRQG